MAREVKARKVHLVAFAPHKKSVAEKSSGGCTPTGFAQPKPDSKVRLAQIVDKYWRNDLKDNLSERLCQVD